MRYLVVIEKSESGWGAYVPDLPGCVATAANKEEALELISEAISLHIEDMREQGLALPAPTSEAVMVNLDAA